MGRKRSGEWKQTLDRFDGGSMTIISDARLGKSCRNSRYAVEATNLQQYEDGIWGPRPGTVYFGKAIPGVGGIDHVAEYNAEDGSLHLVALADNGKGYKSIDNGQTWVEITGATFTPGTQYVVVQFKNQLWISNGVDALVYYDGTQFNAFSEITNPNTAPTFNRGSGLSTGTHKYYVRYTANNVVGWTEPSPAVEITVDKPRESWSRDNNEFVDLTATAVDDAISYDWWIGETPSEVFHIGSTTELIFRDLGNPANTFQDAPDDNTTAAPKVASMELSGSRLWATKDKDHHWRVYGTGTSQYLGFFSPFYGGFWADLERGGRFKPVAVVHYRTGRGDPIATVLCSSPDGRGTIFQIELLNQQVGDVNITIPVAYKLVGSIGSDAVGSVTKFGDNVAFLNKKGMYFLRNKEQMFNVLSTDDVTAPFRDRFEGLNGSQIHKAVGYFSAPRLIFSVPIGEENDTTFVWDDEKRNISWAWNIGFKHITEYTDTNGITHLIACRKDDNRIIEITKNALSDLGKPMFCQYVSPLIPIDANDHRVQARVRESIFEMGEVRGSVQVSVLARTKKTDIASVGQRSITSSFSNSGIGDDAPSEFLASDTTDLPKTFSSSSVKKTVRPRKRVYAIKYRVTSNGVDNDWRLLSIQSHGPYVLRKSPSLWRKE